MTPTAKCFLVLFGSFSALTLLHQLFKRKQFGQVIVLIRFFFLFFIPLLTLLFFSLTPLRLILTIFGQIIWAVLMFFYCWVAGLTASFEERGFIIN